MLRAARAALHEWGGGASALAQGAEICGAILTNSQQVAVKCLEEGEPSLAVKHRKGTGAEWERK